MVLQYTHPLFKSSIYQMQHLWSRRFPEGVQRPHIYTSNRRVIGPSTHGIVFHRRPATELERSGCLQFFPHDAVSVSPKVLALSLIVDNQPHNLPWEVVNFVNFV